MRHLKLLLAAANLGKVGKVAKAFQVSQPAISKQLAEIETALGLRLFDRFGHSLRLTGAGEHVMRSASAMLVEMEDLAKQLGSLGEGITGKVAFGGVATTFITFIPPAMKRFKSRAPHSSVSLHDGSADSLLGRLRDGEIDLFIGRMNQRALPNDIRSEDILDDPSLIVSGVSHPLARKSSADWSSLAGQNWILPPTNLPESRIFLQWLEQRGVKLSQGVIESRSLLANIGLLETDEYLSMMPQSAARVYLREGRIARLAFPACDLLGPMQIVWMEGRLSPAAKLFAECLRDVGHTLR